MCGIPRVVRTIDRLQPKSDLGSPLLPSHAVASGTLNGVVRGHSHCESAPLCL